MARDKISEYDSTASNNTVVADVNIAEGCPPSGINDAIRQVMSALKRFQTGADGDTISAPVFIGTTAAITTANLVNLSATGTATFSGATILSSTLTGTTASFSGAATIGGAAVLSSTLNVTGATTIGGAAVLSSTANITGATTIGGAAVLSSTLGVTGNATLGGTVDITGATTIGGAAVLSSTANISGATTFGSTTVFGGTANFQDNSVQRPTLLDYCIKGSALGSVGTLATIDMTSANFFSATLGSATTFAFTNPCTSGNFGGFVLELTNGGSADVTWPASVDFPGGTAPTLTSSGVDVLVFVTRDAGTTYHGMSASLDSKTPA